jgi:hypothetical protein
MPDGATFCRQCGTDVELYWRAEAGHEPTFELPGEEPDDARRAPRPTNAFALLIVVIAYLAVVVAAPPAYRARVAGAAFLPAAVVAAVLVVWGRRRRG